MPRRLLANNKIILILLLFPLLWSSCDENKPIINVSCDENNLGNSLLRWEIMPEIEGTVKIYASNDPQSFDLNSLIAEVPIDRNFKTIIRHSPDFRNYYQLVFDEHYKVKVASRSVKIDGIQNFRDLGGYHTKSNKSVRWGLLFRSAAINELAPYELDYLKNIGLKSIIDLRIPEEGNVSQETATEFTVYHIPIRVGNKYTCVKALKASGVSASKVKKEVLLMNNDLVLHQTLEYRQLMHKLLDKSNYPLVISSFSGKGRCGFASALILKILEVHQDVILDDYLLSNVYFDIPSVSNYAYNLSIENQRAITYLFSAREEYLDACFKEIIQTYGTFNDYVENGLQLTKTDVAKFRDILLE
ncbi:MAG: tyrosine-protein phosphatase [Bacteroidaceae bacterium]